MCDCFQSAATVAIRCSSTQFGNRRLGLDQYQYQYQCNWSRKPLYYLASESEMSKNKCIRIFPPFMDQRVGTKLGVFGSNAFDSSSEHLELGMYNSEEQLKEFISEENGGFDNDSLKGEKSQNDELGMLNFDQPLMAIENDDGNKDDDLQSKPKRKMMESRSRNQLMKRSSILAKQVIGIESAQSLGFVSQLWVDTATWAVSEVQVRPNLLSSDSVKFLLEDINKVGDVVLVEDENCILNEFRTVGLESLVGCSVVTPRQRNLGKVRGYTFNINSGTVESLELDAFGYSVIPSSLVSTYALFTEDVLEVVSDVIIVREAAASRIQRLSKGFLGTKNAETSSINLKYRDLELESAQPVKDRKSKRKSSKRKSKFHPGTKDLGNDFELPMDYM